MENIAKMKMFPSEHTIQIECICLFRNEIERKGLGVIIPVPNELARKRKDVVIKLGCSDTILVIGSKVIFCEFKTGYNTQSDDQIKFERQVTALGFRYTIIRSIEQFKKLIGEYI